MQSANSSTFTSVYAIPLRAIKDIILNKLVAPILSVALVLAQPLAVGVRSPYFFICDESSIAPSVSWVRTKCNEHYRRSMNLIAVLIWEYQGLTQRPVYTLGRSRLKGLSSAQFFGDP
ncbi:hypothetical protein M422DRAFT_253018 [Sphaerobolus stellatus SS14]|uniref:Uncharacterized protein n=1 Tax=Sphaerobolus stellatus (strain SS14) TaxID=990650 RepID=A0A0C9VXU7_SPHS4|nr:hypothetical protein M422DRAFT_253018 [Sphaerobolus stellatus SS14]